MKASASRQRRLISGVADATRGFSHVLPGVETRAKFKCRYRGIGSDRPHKRQQTWLTLCSVHHQHDDFFPHPHCRTASADIVPSLTKFSRDSLERLPIPPYNAGTNYKKVANFSRWLRWDEKLAYKLEASNQPDYAAYQGRSSKSKRAKAKGVS